MVQERTGWINLRNHHSPHPFYVTADPGYAVAFASKKHSSTGHEKEGITIEFAKNGDDTFVYAMNLNPDSKLLDIRSFDTPEFDELFNLLPEYIRELVIAHAENYASYNKDKKKNVNQYSDYGNDVWYMFELIKNTVVSLLKCNPESKPFLLDRFLSVNRIRYDTWSEYRSFEDKINRLICDEWKKLHKTADMDSLMTQGTEIFVDDAITEPQSRDRRINKKK